MATDSNLHDQSTKRPARAVRRVVARVLTCLCTVTALVGALSGLEPAAATPGVPVWAMSYGGASSVDSAADVVSDSLGNTIVLSTVYGPTSIGGTPVTTQNLDVVVASIAPNGLAKWVRVIGGANNEYAGHLSTDNSGNLYVTGTFQGSLTVAGTTVQAKGNNDAFLTKLSWSGVPQWVRSMGDDAGSDPAPYVAADSSGDVVIASNVWGNYQFGNAATVKNSGTKGDIYLARYSGTGAFKWVTRDGGVDAVDSVHGLSFDSRGNGGMLLLGEYEGSSSQVAGKLLTGANPSGGAYVAHFDVNGAGNWATGWQGTVGVNASSIDVGRTGQILVGGDVYGALNLPGLSLAAKTAGIGDALMIELSPTGAVVSGATYHATGDTYVRALHYDWAGNIVLALDLHGTIALGGIAYSSLGNTDLLLATVSPSGTPLWSTRIGGSGFDIAAAVTVAGDDPVVVGQITANASYAGGSFSSDTGQAIALRFGQAVPTSATSRYFGMTPQRVLDSRDGTGGYSTPWSGALTRNVKVAGANGVPANATAVVLNVTATGGSANTHLTVFPTGSPMPASSNVNAAAGTTVANLVTVASGLQGFVSIYNNSGNVDVIADVTGYYVIDVTGARFNGITPVRELDSRNGTGGYSTPWSAGTVRDVAVAGVNGVPADATAVVLNLTAVAPSDDTHLTLWPAGQPKPTASSLNVSAGTTRANLAIAKVGTGGKVAIFNNAGTVQVVADAVGYFSATTGNAFNPIPPARVADSRIHLGLGPLDPWGPGMTQTLQLAEDGGVPDAAKAVVLNVTATNPTAASHLTVYPEGVAMPVASNLNFVAGQTVPNQVIVKLGSSGQINIYNNSGNTDVIVDVVGWYS